MPIHDQSYRHYGGLKAVAGRSWLVIAWAGIRQFIGKRAFIGLMLFALSPFIVRAGAAASGELLRLELHPADLDHPRCVGAVERVLQRARGRTAVTYDDLAAL